MRPYKNKKVNSAALASLAQSLGDIIRCGIPITDAFEIIERTQNNHYQKNLISEIKNGVKDGNSISKSMENVNVFPSIFIEMILIGESTGNLQETFQSLAIFYTNINNLKKKLSMP